MDAATLFKIFNSLALLAWIPLLFLPRWKGTDWLIRYKPVPAFLGCAYAILLVVGVFGQSDGSPMDFSSLEAVKNLFSKDEAVLLGWIHYLAFDLMVGMYELEDGQARKIPHLLLVPCLLLTFIFGPVGWFLYWILRSRFPLKTAENK